MTEVHIVTPKTNFIELLSRAIKVLDDAYWAVEELGHQKLTMRISTVNVEMRAGLRELQDIE